MSIKRFASALLATVSCAAFAAVSFAQAPKPAPSASPAGKMGKMDKTAKTKKTPARDSKGRFIKATPVPAASPKPKM